MKIVIITIKSGQKEVNNKLKSKKQISVLDMALFFYLLEQPNYSGFNFEQYIEITIRNNANQMYRQALINIQQQKELEVENNEFQRIINQQNNQRLCINNDKISGFMDLQLIGLNNLAKVEGIKKEDKNAKVRFIAIVDGKETEMCHSLDRQEFYIDKENVFNRYYGETQKELRIERIKCKGLVMGLNLPPITHHFHYCRSYIVYVKSIEEQAETGYNIANYIRKNSYTDSKTLDKEIKKAIKLLPENIRKLLKDTKFYITNKDSCYDRNNDEIHLLKDADKYEILHEIGHAIETKLDILHNKEYIKIQQDGIDIHQMDIDNIKGYDKKYKFCMQGDKFISEYQRLVYEQDIDKNDRLNFINYTFNTKTLGEYFSEGFRCYFENNNLLKRKDTELYNYIKEVLR